MQPSRRFPEPQPRDGKRFLSGKLVADEAAPPASWYANDDMKDGESDCDSVKSDYQVKPEDSPAEGRMTPGTAHALELCRPESSSSKSSNILPDRQIAGRVQVRTGSASSMNSLPGIGPGSLLQKAVAAGTNMSHVGVRLDRNAANMSLNQSMNQSMIRSQNANRSVNASTAGEWLTRIEALNDLQVEFSEVAGRIVDSMCGALPEAESHFTGNRQQLITIISQELGQTQKTISRHAQGILGSDLAELRMAKCEMKQLTDKLNKMNRHYTKELARVKGLSLREDGREPVQKAFMVFKNQEKEIYDSMSFLSKEQRSCVLQILEGQLADLFREVPELEGMANKPKMNKLKDQFTQERINALDKLVETTTEENRSLREKSSNLMQANQELQQELELVLKQKAYPDDRSMVMADRQETSITADSFSNQRSTSSLDTPEQLLHRDSSPTAKNIEATSPVSPPPPPEGKPKAGRFLRAAKFTSN